MSTTYGKIKLRDGGELEVEAFGVAGCVKLIKTGLDANIIVINDPVELTKLMSLLDVAYGHVWQDE